VQSYEAPADLAAPPVRGLRGLYERFAHLIHELGKFGVVGAVCYGIDLAIFNLAEAKFGWGWFPALLLSTIVSASCAFLGNRYWTWRDRERSGLRREYLLYFFFNLVGLAIGLACLIVSHYWLGRTWPVLTTKLADLISANVIGMALGTMFRFWSYRRFVFRPQSVTATATTDEEK
jgi:putative flippase GtrA